MSQCRATTKKGNGVNVQKSSGLCLLHAHCCKAGEQGLCYALTVKCFPQARMFKHFRLYLVLLGGGFRTFRARGLLARHTSPSVDL